MTLTMHMSSHVRRVAATAAAVVATTVPLLGVATGASATYEPGEPEVAWGRQVTSPAEESYGD